MNILYKHRRAFGRGNEIKVCFFRKQITVLSTRLRLQTMNLPNMRYPSDQIIIYNDQYASRKVIKFDKSLRRT